MRFLADRQSLSFLFARLWNPAPERASFFAELQSRVPLLSECEMFYHVPTPMEKVDRYYERINHLNYDQVM
jgi:hypothetical protein